MPSVTGKPALLALAIVLPSIASAIPDVNFPVNSQVPPVARASEPYNFTFADSTFTSTAGPITYTLSNEPAWLRLDNRTRTFSGSPAASDVGPTTFCLLATDVEGLTPLSVTLVVIQNEGLEVGKSISAQLAGFGIPSNSLSLLLYPLQSFAFRFSPDTFLQISSSTVYYALSEDNSPLPSWLQFNASDLGFAGTTPPLISPSATPQTYVVKLIASDVPGFLEASAIFQVLVSYHILAFSVANESIVATSGRGVASSPLRETLRLDGRPVLPTELVSVTANAPSWLLLDHENISLSGVPPADATSLSVTISVMDVLGDVANATLDFTISNSTCLFLGDVPMANATIGQQFNYTISRHLLATANVTLVADLGRTSAWLSFDPDGLSFKGKVPQGLAPGQIQIALYATSGHNTEEKYLRINVERASATTSVSRTASVTASIKLYSTSAAGSSTPANIRKSMPGSRTTPSKIVLVVFLSTVGLIFLVTLLIFLWRHDRKALAESTVHVLDPIPAPAAAQQVEHGLSDAGVVEPVQSGETEQCVVANEPPRIELSWAPDSLRKAKARLSNRTSASGGKIKNTSFYGTLPKDMESLVPNSRTGNDIPQQSNRRPEDLTPFVGTATSNFCRQRMPLGPTQSRTEDEADRKRASKALSAMSTATLRLPGRLSGAGHGAGGVGPPTFNEIRSSWQDTESSLTSMTSRAKAFDIVDEFPQPPVEAVESRKARTSRSNEGASLRLIGTSSNQMDSPVDERQGRRMEGARDPFERVARFSNMWSSRPHLGGQRLEAENSTLGHYDQFIPQTSPRERWLDCAAVGALMRPDITTRCRPYGRPFTRPLSKAMRDRSIASSGQFDSALSTSSSQWEDEVLTTEVGFQQDKTQHFAESARRDGQRTSLCNTYSRGSATIASPLGEASSAGELDVSSASPGWRPQDVPSHTPVRNGKGKLQTWERNQHYNLAFI